MRQPENLDERSSLGNSDQVHADVFVALMLDPGATFYPPRQCVILCCWAFVTGSVFSCCWVGRVGLSRRSGSMLRASRRHCQLDALGARTIRPQQGLAWGLSRRCRSVSVVFFLAPARCPQIACFDNRFFGCQCRVVRPSARDAPCPACLSGVRGT